MANLYLTQDIIGTPSGGGKVTRDEFAFLQRLGEQVYPIDANIIKLTSDPFENDARFRMACEVFCRDIGIPKYVHIYSGSFTETVKFLKSKGSKISYTVAAHDRKLSIEEFNIVAGGYPHKHISDDALFDRYIEGCRIADVVICPSNKSKSLMESWGCKNVKVIPHAVERKGPALWPGKPNRFTVGYLGVGGPDKGLRYLFQAWKMLDIQNGMLLLAGNNLYDVTALWEKHGGRNIESMGFVDNVDDFYSRISVYVQPSVTEGFGIEVLEAIERGIPVVVSEGAGASDCVKPENGIIIPIRSPEAIVEGIMKYYESPDKIETAKSYSTNAGKYHIVYIANYYLDIWRIL